MSDSGILVEICDGYHIITLNRPDKLNAFNEHMHLALADALNAAESSSDCRAILLTAAGKGFCAGQDLGDRVRPKPGAPAPDLSKTIDMFYNPLIRKLRNMPIPVICAVNGVAAGAGANIALACDIVFAARSARFIQAFSKIGLIPDSGGTYFLPRLIGSARARAITLLATPVFAEQAEEWGMIWKAIDDDKLLETAIEHITKLAHGPSYGYGLLKEALNASQANTLDQQLDLESALQGKAGRSPDYMEGVMAFMEKRKPAFTGKGE